MVSVVNNSLNSITEITVFLVQVFLFTASSIVKVCPCILFVFDPDIAFSV